MIGNNADIIFGAAGSVNLGILEVLNEKDLYMIGTDTDQYMRLIADGKESNPLPYNLPYYFFDNRGKKYGRYQRYNCSKCPFAD